MIKIHISYKNLNGMKVSEDVRFNLSVEEALDLDNKYIKAYESTTTRVLANAVQTNDVTLTYKILKDIVLVSYGVVSADGNRFAKNQDLRDGFANAPVMDAILIKLMTEAGAIKKFMDGIMPDLPTAPKGVKLPERVAPQDHLAKQEPTVQQEDSSFIVDNTAAPVLEPTMETEGGSDNELTL
jgi:hypothetical protein